MTVSNEDRNTDWVIQNVMAEWRVRQDPASIAPGESLAGAIRRALVSHGWGPTRQMQIDTLLAARDAAREARRLCWAEERDEHTIRHWSATAGWLASRAKKIEVGEEPDWPDAASPAPDRWSLGGQIGSLLGVPVKIADPTPAPGWLARLLRRWFR